MTDQRLGNAVRRVRIRLGWRQDDVAAKARVSQSTVSRLERGHLESLSMDVIRRVAGAVDVQVAVIPRWRGGDLDRLLNAGHSVLHNEVAAMFRDEFPEWTIAPEVSFAIRGERGVIDLVAWHAEARALLIIELKTDIVDVNELLGTFDRKRRLAWQIAPDPRVEPDDCLGLVDRCAESDQPVPTNGTCGRAACCIPAHRQGDQGVAAQSDWECFRTVDVARQSPMDWWAGLGTSTAGKSASNGLKAWRRSLQMSAPPESSNPTDIAVRG
jgi:transcriptional regulator with XRE-family HTH domain